MTQALADIIARVHPGSGSFRIEPLAGGAFLQYERMAHCSETGALELQRGRKWYVSRYATEQEIFRTCYLAVRVFDEHELNERFKVDGKRLLDPHPEGQRVEGRVTWQTLF